MKQTAVEWLIEQVKSKEWQVMFIWHKEEVFKQALKMEKEQIIMAYETGDKYKFEIPGEQYYNETYKSK
jgi:hypothetical protein